MLLLASLAMALPPVDSPLRLSGSGSADAAVVIGIEDYAFLPDVPFAERDAWAVSATLSASVGVPRGKVHVLVDNPSREQMLAAVTEAADSIGDDGTVWVYFAGHGAADPASGERILLGVDAQAERDAFASRGISVDAIERAAIAGGADVFLLIDACFTGKGRDGDALVPGARMVIPTSWSTPSGMTEWSATQPSQWASPLEDAQHGAFTYAVLGAMRGWADGYTDGQPDGVVTTDEAHAYVERTLRDLGVRNQQPSYTGSDRLLVSGSLEAAPDLRPSARVPTVNLPPTAQFGPRRRDMRVVAGAGAVAGVGLITGIAAFAAGSENRDATPQGLQTLKTLNTIGFATFGVGAVVGGVAAVVPTRQGAVIRVGGTF